MGKNVIAINDETPPDNFKFMFKEKIFKTEIPLLTREGLGVGFDLIISFDAASLDQL
jgi:hypothetical protein